jgi:hypothetical protein
MINKLFLQKITTTTPAPTTTGWDQFTSVSANYDDYYFYPEKDWQIKETTTTDRYEPTTTSVIIIFIFCFNPF